MRLRLVLFGLLSTACPSPAAPSGTGPSPKDPADEVHFDIAVDAPKSAPVGKPARASVDVRARAPWHMNLEYPATLRIDAPTSVELDADIHGFAALDAFDGEHARFAVPFVGRTKGEQRFSGRVQFAVCAEEACAPESVPLEFTVDVGCDTTVC